MSHERDPRILEDSWMKQSALFEQIKKNGGMQQYVETIPMKEAFQREVGAACCIDEGVNEGQMRIAGSGILHPGGVEAVAKLMVDAGVTEVTSHAECGAAKLAYVKEFGDARVDSEKVDAYARKWAEDVAARISALRGREVSARHITTLDRPKGFHDARSVYIDGTGRFNPAVLGEQLPKGFVVSAALIDQGHLRQNIDVAVTIALGDHGFGNRFTKEHPLVFIPIGGEGEGNDLSSLTAILQPILEKYKGRVRIDGFAVPAKDIAAAA